MSLVVDHWESKCGCLIADRANKLSYLPHVLKGVGSKENSDDYVVGGFYNEILRRLSLRS